ncbi:PD-(D/E)XK nuclease family protein [Patescibacteria group bacterium]|nr:PD-(D/E)XK nuclease family protein [Patescibacteria group bacterium]
MSDITYSISRIGAFSPCRLRYKYQYIDKLKSDLESIEAFRGSRCHEALEEFYKLVKAGSIKPLDWVMSKYEEVWNKNYTDTIKIVKKDLTVDDYFNKGKQALIDYYERYKPFDQTKIIDTERNVSFKVKHDNREYAFRGILDRLDWNDKTDMFEIHDYKATNKLMTQEEADNDPQLGLYHVALKEKWPDTKEVKLVWHSLLFNKELVSTRTEQQLIELQAKIAEKVQEIESCDVFTPLKTALCNWCDFQNICPMWKHPKKMEELPVNEYKKDPGVKLVEKYAKLEEKRHEFKEEIKEIEEEQEKIEEAAIEFAEKNDIAIIDGPNAQLKIDIKDELKAPTKTEDSEAWNKLREFFIKEGKLEDVATVNNAMVRYQLNAKQWPSDLINKVKDLLKRQITKKAKLVKKR